MKIYDGRERLERMIGSVCDALDGKRYGVFDVTGDTYMRAKLPEGEGANQI